MYNDDNIKMKFIILPLAEYNYYNDKNQIIRVAYEDKLIDCPLIPTYYIPDPSEHLALILCDDQFLSSYIDSEHSKYKPGIINDNGDLSNFGFVFSFLINKHQKISTTYPVCSNVGFSINEVDMSKDDKVSAAIVPYSNRDYTNTDKTDDTMFDNVGFFINKSGNILIRSKGASLTMGEEGIHIGGPVFWDQTAHDKGIMQDNTLHDFIGSTIPTYVLSLKELPNFNKILSIGDVGQKIIRMTNKFKNFTRAL